MHEKSDFSFFFPQFFTGQVFSQKLLSLRDQHKTAEGSPSDDDSYLGYSVATGEFNGDGDRSDVVVGMPRGANLTGKVNFILERPFFSKFLSLISAKLPKVAKRQTKNYCEVKK